MRAIYTNLVGEYVGIHPGPALGDTVRYGHVRGVYMGGSQAVHVIVEAEVGGNLLDMEIEKLSIIKPTLTR